jgi:maleate isomerase
MAEGRAKGQYQARLNRFRNTHQELAMSQALRRIGALIPPGNVTVEYEFARFAPAGVHVHYNRLYRPSLGVDKEGLLLMIKSAEQASKGLAQVSPEVILYACTSGSFLSGPGREDEIGEMIRGWTGIPAYTTSSAVVMGLKALAAKRVFMLTPYADEIHAEEIEFLRFRGIAVDGHDTFRCTDTVQIRDITSEQVAERVLQHRAQASKCDAVFISCTNLHTMDQIERLEHELQVPVTTSNHCTLWAALRHMKEPTGGLGLGRLFELPVKQELHAA